MEDFKLREKIKRWIKDPVLFVMEVFGAEPSPHQIELLTAYKERNNSIAVRSGHGCGKSACLAWIVIHFLLTRPQCKIICTAPTKRQLKDILWSEISLWISKSIPAVREMVDIMSERIKIKGREDWWARAVSINVQATPEEQAEALAGIHSKHLLVVIDEASGIPEPVFLPIEGYLTNKDNFVIMTSNPTRTSGYYYKVFNEKAFGDGWKKINWNSEESPLVSPDWVRRMGERYGKGSDTYRVRVLGDFPKTGVKELIPMSWIRRNLVNISDIEIVEPVVWGIDPAGMGGDETSLIKRSSNVLFYSKGKQSLEEPEMEEWFLHEYYKDDVKPQAIFIDTSGGYGTGISQRLRSLLPSTKVYGVHFGWRANNPSNFVLLRDELWWKTRELFEHNYLKVVDDNTLISQLSGIKYTETDSGKIKIESKKQMRNRGIGSPDRAEALVVSTYLDVPSVYNRGNVKKRKRSRRVNMWKVA